MAVTEVVDALDRYQDAEPDGIAAPLIQHVVLTKELDRLVAAGAQQSHLQPAHQPEAILEPDDGPVVEPEQIVGDIAEVALAERPGKPMGHPERAFHARQAERRRQVDEREIGLRNVWITIGVVGLGGSWRLVLSRLGGAWQREQQDDEYADVIHPHGFGLATLRTISMPRMSPWPVPQYSEQIIGKLPSVVAVKSIVTGSPPRGTSFLIFSFLISRPWTPSPERTTSCSRSPTFASISAGSKANRRAVTSTTRGPGVWVEGPPPSTKVATASDVNAKHWR